MKVQAFRETVGAQLEAPPEVLLVLLLLSEVVEVTMGHLSLFSPDRCLRAHWGLMTKMMMTMMMMRRRWWSLKLLVVTLALAGVSSSQKRRSKGARDELQVAHGAKREFVKGNDVITMTS